MRHFMSTVVPMHPLMYSIRIPYGTERRLAVATEPGKANKRKRRKAVDLSKVGERNELRAQREPFWQRLRTGCFLGFRPSKRGGKGTWIARAYDEDAGRYHVKSLGDFGTLAGNEMFAAAKKEAEKLAELVEAGGEVRRKVETVADACREYLKTHPGKIAEGVFNRHIYSDAVAKVKLDKLRRHHLRDWRKRLEEAPAIVSRSRKGEVRTRNRAQSTVNRDMAPFRAALNKVLAPGAPNSEAAWQEALKPFENADQRRLLYLDKSERRTLLAHIADDARPFVRALCLLPLRPGAMAALVAGDYDKRTAELTIGKDKAGGKRRILLPTESAALFAQQAKGKLPAASMFMRANGKPWDRNSWGDAIENAAKAAKLPKGTTAYTLRHSTITDLVSAGLPLLTIAQISGTSAEMIERHYGHLASDAAVKALGELAL
ncbi:tyrosine-type recombinase/integrase [Novosphingobium album (ex Hu et al. 2023)]|uniref:Tyrosine-type recombinase/integrase n=1 Tax=Novosphingobium album (ex Hu et al. 2023) TaxID=2930093 RepID=A0ABT0B739_9SPHN|nr:tyrosine-type recombinase/integrase [Novosphingobium album (ex Hu et al. 2023)]MCJ2180890.1 tyrosine-type recombinase/integrase [Novosphingobium album (ex Hu et al. 2023)]